jgi:YfiH family protein
VVDRPWATVRQVHGTSVVVVDDGCDLDGLGAVEADALVTARRDVALSVQGADCGVVGLWSPEGVVAVAHAGWRGLLAGVLPATVAQMHALGAGSVRAVLGPCIGPECYEFGAADLDLVAERLGPAVRSTTSWGSAALDLPAALSIALADAGVVPTTPPAACTSCEEATHWSHRARRDVARQAVVVWVDGGAA